MFLLKIYLYLRFITSIKRSPHRVVSKTSVYFEKPFPLTAVLLSDQVEVGRMKLLFASTINNALF